MWRNQRKNVWGRIDWVKKRRKHLLTLMFLLHMYTVRMEIGKLFFCVTAAIVSAPSVCIHIARKYTELTNGSHKYLYPLVRGELEHHC